jgi:hypothetical protein
MRIARVVWAAAALWAGWTAVGVAEPLRYEGRTPGAQTGQIELAPGHVREVAVGDEIPGWGRVTDVAETHMLIEQRVSEAAQARLRSQGKAVYEILELRIPRTGPGGAAQLPHR